MKKFLYIIYYWPPCGGISVVRNLKIAKYARSFHWEPVVYAPKDANYPVIDETTFKDIPEGLEVLKQPVLEPFGVFNMVQGKKKDEKVQDVFLVRDKKPGLGYQMGIWVRGNFFIPDARMLWIKPSVKYLKKYLAEHKVDAIISYGPPHTTHRIAYHLKKHTGLPWIADFQDPWTQIDYFEKFMLTDWARKRHVRMEQEVLTTADKVVTVSKSWQKDMEELSGREVECITFGYDEDDFEGVPPVKTDKFIISHFGTLGLDRNPAMLWKVLADICSQDAQFRQDMQVVLAGLVDYTVFEDIEQNGLKDNLNFSRFLKKDEVVAWMKASDVQLLLLNKGYGNYNVLGRTPAKLFEYLGSGQPILVLGPKESDVAHIVDETRSGTTCEYTEETAIRHSILAFYDAWKKGEKLYHPQNIEQYSFRNLTGRMMGLLDEITAGR